MDDLKKIIKTKGTLQAAAAYAGISRQYLHRILNGEPCGVWVARLLEKYTDGLVKADDLVSQQKRGVFEQRLSS